MSCGSPEKTQSVVESDRTAGVPDGDSSLHDGFGQRDAPLFVVGAPKCGTTSLYESVRQSERFALPSAKEPIYFCEDVVAERPTLTQNRPVPARFRSATRVHASYASTQEEYEALYDRADHRPRADFSTFNFASVDAPRRICEHDPRARIVLLAREPMRRILSHYAMDRVHGYFTGNLNDELEAELASEGSASFSTSRLYLRQTDYVAAYRRYREYFPASQVKLFVLEELLGGSCDAHRALWSFLHLRGELVGARGLSSSADNKAVAPRGHVASWMVRSPLYKLARSRLSAVVPAEARALIRDVLFRNATADERAGPEPLLSEIVETRLDRIRSETEALLGRSLPAWRLAGSETQA